MLTENDDVTTSSSSSTVTIPVTPQGALFFESFENGLGRMRHIDSTSVNGSNLWQVHQGPTLSVLTGPTEAIRGHYYLYTESSEQLSGDQFMYAFLYYR